MIQAILFDMDGVLTDTERSGGLMLVRAMANQGFAIQDTQWQSLIGTSMEYTNHALTGWFPGLDSDQFYHDWKAETFAYVHTYSVPKKKGAEEALDALADKGYLLGLCTNNIASVVHEYLGLLGWRERFQVILAAEDVTRRKPAPDTYLLAAERLGIPADRCVGVEDSPSGLTAVHRAGMITVRIPDLIDTSNVPDSIIDVTLPDLTALPAFVEQAASGLWTRKA